MTQRCRVGVIGAGAWAVANHLPILASRPDVELVAVCRKGSDELSRLKDRFGFRYASEQASDVFDQNLDAVIVSSPVLHHREHVEGALQSGAHVLCEKPFTITSDDAWTLVNLANSVDRHLLVAYGWNYHPMTLRAKQLMSSQGVGTVEHVFLAMATAIRELLVAANPLDFGGGVLTEPATYNDPAISGGGYSQAQLTHALALAVWLSGESPQYVHATMYEADRPGVDLHVAMSVRFASGATFAVSGATSASGALVADGDNERQQLEVRIFGDAGQLVLEYERALVWAKTEGSPNVRVDLEPDAGAYVCTGPVNTLVDLALGRPVENCSPGSLGAATVDLIEAAYESHRTSSVVQISKRTQSR